MPDSTAEAPGAADVQDHWLFGRMVSRAFCDEILTEDFGPWPGCFHSDLPLALIDTGGTAAVGESLQLVSQFISFTHGFIFGRETCARHSFCFASLRFCSSVTSRDVGR